MKPTQTEIHEQLARDIVASRTTGAPMVACLLGAHRVAASDAAFALAFDTARPAASGGAGLIGLVTLADLALGGAIRKRIGRERGLQTVSLTVQLGTPAPGPVVVYTEETSVAADSLGATRGQARSGGAVVADFLASFNIPAPGTPLSPLPWEDDEPSVPSDLTLTTVENAVVDSIGTHQAADGPWADLEVRRACTAEAGHRLLLRPTVAMLNRFGFVQGAVLFGLAAESARVAAEPGMALRYGHLDFVSAARSDAPTLAEASVLRAGRSTAFIASRITQAGELVAAGSFLFRARR